MPPGGCGSFDTATPLIGGPADVVAEIYAKVPNSKPLDGDFAGFYGFRMFVFPFVEPLLDIPFAPQLVIA